MSQLVSPVVADPRAITVRDQSRPFASYCVAFNRGSLADPIGKAGLGWLTSQMLLRGTTKHNRAELAEAYDHLGAAVDVSLGRDQIALSADGLTRVRQPLLDLLAETLYEPSFNEDELAKLKRETLADLLAVIDDDGSLGMRFFSRQLYGAHPYGRPTKGSKASLAAITREDLQAFHQRIIESGGIAGVAGDLADQDRESVVNALLGPTQAKAAQKLDLELPPPTPSGWRVLLVDKPQRSQTQIFIGQLALSAIHPEWTALQVGQTCFGGTFTSRFSYEIREKRGWSYGAWSQLSGDARLGNFLLRFYPSTKDTLPGLELSHQLLKDFCASGPTREEFEAAQSYLQNSFVFGVDTASKRLSELLTARIFGYGDDHVDNTVERLAAVSYEAAVEAVKQHIQPDNMAVTIVGSASDLESSLRQHPLVASLDIREWTDELADICH